jgi:hypothetical protein
MEIQYSIRGEKLPITLAWFDEDCLEEEHELETAIEECARHYHEHHDGWESTWPMTIKLFADGKEIGSKEVSQHYEPAFECN